MGMNPLVGHKVDRYWADVSQLMTPACPSPQHAVAASGCTSVEGPMVESECVNDSEQDKKWWNGIITDYNGLTREHW